MDQSKINVSHNYCKYFHTNSGWLVWIDGRGNPIPIDMDLSTHVDCKSPEDLWNHRKTRQGWHSKDLTAQGRGNSNSTAATQNIPPHWAHQPHFARGPPRKDDVVGSILRDTNIDQGLLEAAITQLPPHLSSMFVPQMSALVSHGPGSAENLHLVSPQSQASAPHQNHPPLTWPIN